MLYQATLIPSLGRRVAALGTSLFALFAATLAPAETVSAPLSVTTLAGTAGERQVTNGTGTAARFYAPAGIVVNASGDLIVADTCNNVFRKVTTGGVVTIFAGAAVDPDALPINIGSADGAAADARFHIGDYASSGGTYGPPIYTTVGSNTLGVDSGGNVYLADTMNNTIRKITPGSVVSTIAGGPGSQGSADGAAADARFLVPSGVAADSAGNVYVADSGNKTIRKITAAGVVSTIAGTAGQFGTTDGTGAAARFSNPAGIAIDSNGNLYVTDSGSHTIRKITPGGVVSTLAGSPGSSGTADGSGTQARFYGPTGIAVDSSGNVYVADTLNHALRRVTPAGTVSTIAGTKGTSGSADGTGSAALFYEPFGVTVATNGTVYIADTSNNTIRAGVAASGSGSLEITGIPPSLIQVNTGANVTLKVVATGTPAPTYQWSKGGAAVTGATSATLQLNGVTSANAGYYTVTVTSGLLTYTTAQTQLQVFAASVPVPSVTLVTQPTDVAATAGQSATFTVEATSAQPLTYQWTKDGSAITGATNATYTITTTQSTDAAVYAATVTDGTSVATTRGATLTVTGGAPTIAPSFTTHPNSQSVETGATVTFTAAASGTPAPTYQWQKDGAVLGNSATVSGATTATLTIMSVSTADAATYTVVATNAAGSAVSNPATLTVTEPQPPSSGPAAWLTNISVRTTIVANQSPLIVGLSVKGGAKNILIRGAGPALANVGVSSGFQPDPQLRLFTTPDDPLVISDDWDAALAPTFAAAGAFGFNAVSKDAAFVRSLEGGYTVHAMSDGGPGLVLFEAYDLDSSTNSPRLFNISARNRVGTGDDVTILGFYIQGTGTKRLLVRAAGPKLADFGVASPLANPKVELYLGQQIIAENDDWDAGLAPTFDSVGAFQYEPGSKDSAMIVTLDAGTTYTVIAKGVNGGTGEAIVEVYELP